MTQYAAVFTRPSGGDAGRITVAEVTPNFDHALQILAEARNEGAEVVGVFNQLEGTIVYTAKFVQKNEVTKTPGRPKRKAAKLKPSDKKRTPEQLLQLGNRIHAWLVKCPEGEGIEAISKSLRIPSKDLTRPMAQLIEAKRARKRGERRATKYFPTKRKAVKRKTRKRK